MLSQAVAGGSRAMASTLRVDSKKSRRWHASVALSVCIVFPYLVLLSRFGKRGSGTDGRLAAVKEAMERIHSDSHPQSVSCELSLKESNGFFCESDAVWRRRRTIFARQEKKQINNQFSPGGYSGHNYFAKHLSNWWQQNYEPNFSCAYEERIGNQGDGGKWVCDPYRIHELSKKRKCVVYSLGSNNDFSFEKAVLERLPLCEVHTFDHTIVLKKEKKPDEVHFHSWGLGAENDGNIKTLETIRRLLGHDSDSAFIEILKVDIEGSEWKTIIPALEKDELRWARQLLIELHPRKIEVMRPLWSLLKQRGWVTHHKEPNLFQAGTIQEYGFFNLGWTVPTEDEEHFEELKE